MFSVNNDCVGCEQCLDVCPSGAISIDGGRAVIDTLDCVECGECKETCPMYAIEGGNTNGTDYD